MGILCGMTGITGVYKKVYSGIFKEYTQYLWYIQDILWRCPLSGLVCDTNTGSMTEVILTDTLRNMQVFEGMQR